jgi:hypothetical protein
MIHHTVFFTLNYPAGSVGEKAFFKAAEVLTTIPGVRDFHLLKEISPKNHFDFGFAMQFKGQTDYDLYNRHPLHVQFVEQHWVPSVSDFIEIDYEIMA